VWLAQKINAADDRTLRLFAVWCARLTPLGDGRVTGDLLTDPRSRAALEVAERYANGQATADELATATRAADTARDAGCTFAADAAYAACAVCAAYAAAYAARAVHDAYAAYAAYAAAVRAVHDARLAQANQFRRMVKNPFPRTEAQS
jgi:hypothetical protein